MASLSCLLSLSLAFIVISTCSATRFSPLATKFSSPSSKNLKSSNSTLNNFFSGNYTRVCDASRFANLGMEMANFAYCDSKLPYEVRVKDLVDRMTIEEKAMQLGDSAAGVARLGLPSYGWWSEALHGVSYVGNNNKHATFFDAAVPSATSFPTPVLTAATFNESLWKLVAQAISTEARAMYNLGHAGLTFWSPVINVVRDPRWGRILETPGEDPYTVGRYSINFVRGLQDLEGTTENVTDLNSRPLKVAGCCKHYVAYDLENWSGIDRYHFDARVTDQDMEESFVRPFEMCVREGDAASVMCSYNSVNGIPVCADRRLLKDTIRGKWNLHGYVVTDCDTIEVVQDDHKWLNDDAEDAVSQVLEAGVDMNCGYYYMNHVSNAVGEGRISERQVDTSLNYLYVVLMRLGYFDGNPRLESLSKNDICSDDHIELATHTAREGIVLLKNINQTLPLNSSKTPTIALVGPHADATRVMIGNYEGVPCEYISPIKGFSQYGKVVYEKGCDDVACKSNGSINSARQAAKQADMTIVMVGTDLSIEAEGLDRVDLLLPGYQQDLITQVAASSRGPVTVVIMSAGGLDVSTAKNDPNVNAILWAGFPGEQGGRAIADVVFGKYNPGGRLPITWYENGYINKFPMTSMQFRPKPELGYPGRTYRFYNGPTMLYPFAYGLSYTQFNYSLASAQRSVAIQLDRLLHCKDLNYSSNSYKPGCPSISVDDLNCCQDFKFDVVVKNVGQVGGSEAVLVYSAPPDVILGAPLKQVVAFQKVFVEAGANQTVTFSLNVCESLLLVDYKGNKVLPAGTHTILVGDQLTFPMGVLFKHRSVN